MLHIFKNEQIKLFLDWIYRDADLYIERKYKKYIGILDINNSLSE